MRDTPQAQHAAAAEQLRIPRVDEPVRSLAAFERALKPRTSVPTQRYTRFLALDDETLACAGVTITHAANHLKRVLEDLRGRATRVDDILAGLSPTFFSEDHGWRAIFVALGAAGPRFSEHKVLAVANYRRYLLHCLDALSHVSTDRLQSQLCRETSAQGEENTSIKGSARAGYDSARDRQEGLVRDLVRLPRGATLRLRQGHSGPFDLWMGKRRFRVETWDGASLVDEQGKGSELHDGRNVVGRGLYNDVIVDARFSDVSRRHLILDLADGMPAAITDLSSGGTFVSRALVSEAA